MSDHHRRKWVSVYNTLIEEEAFIVAGRLRDHGLEVMLNGQTSTAFGMLTAIADPIHVMVDAEHAEVALGLLSAGSADVSADALEYMDDPGATDDEEAGPHESDAD
jgi:hypothetical protein